MNKFRLNLLAVLLLLAASVPAFGQFYPLPASTTESPAICTGCPGVNPTNQPNDGLPMVPYAMPIRDHVGRLVDSVNFIDQTPGMRTARAGKVRIAPARGSFPGRVYLQLGSTIGAYSLNTFFTSTVPGGLQPVNRIPTGSFGSRALERVVVPDAWVYPEASKSGWTLNNSDGNDRLYDFDVDDRGYIYAAYSIFGLGIIQDDGRTGAAMLPLTSQVIFPNCSATGVDPKQCHTNTSIPFGPLYVFTIKSGSEYYTAVTDGNRSASAKVAIYNTTNPTTFQMPIERVGRAYNFVAWAKSPDLSRVAIIDTLTNLHIYSASQYVSGGSALVDAIPSSTSRQFSSVTADEQGNFWALEGSPQGTEGMTLWKFAPSGAGYTTTKYPITDWRSGETPGIIDNGAGVLGVVSNHRGDEDVRLYDIKSGTPSLIDVKGYFGNHYHLSPAGYADYEARTNTKAIRGHKHTDGKTYLIYNAYGVGDVYELQVGASLTATRTNSAEFYGDEFTFTSASATSEFPLNVFWNFGNPEAGTANEFASRTGSTARHRFTGLTTAAAITAPKTVAVSLATDAGVRDSVIVNLKVPQARVKAVAKTASAAAPATGIANNAELVYGDEFDDISDGEADGHYNVWTIDGADETLASTANKSAGALGSHTVKYAAKYGPQNSTAPVFTSAIGPFNYKVLPFVATLNPTTRSGSAVTFSATGRYTTDPTVLPATVTQWTTTWTLKSGGTDVVPPQAQMALIGTIPNFVVSQTIPANAVLSLTLSVPSSSLPAAAQNYSSYSLTTTLETPTDVNITTDGCANAGNPCTATATPVGTTTPNWDKIEWVVKLGATTKFTGTGTTVDIASKIDVAGTYTITLTVSRSIFTKVVEKTITVAASLCNGPLPTANNMSLGIRGETSGCIGTGCTAGETITLMAQGWGYNIQTCDEFVWNFGDGTSKTTSTPETTKVYAGNGPYSATLQIRNKNTGQTSSPFARQISFGSGNPNPEPPPPATCNAPTTVNFSYAGNKGCSSSNGIACKTDEIVTFTATKNSATAQSCDTVTWNFGTTGSANGKTVTYIFGVAGTHNVTVTVSNSAGTLVSAPRAVTVQSGTTDSTCPLSLRGLSISYTGLQSGCSLTSATQCRRGETIRFNVDAYNYEFQACDTFLWNFNDGSANGTTKQVDHVFPNTSDRFTVNLRVKNTNNELNLTAEIRIEGADVPATPVLAVSGPTTAGRNSTVTFSATSDIANATGWAWEFSDNTGVDNSQNAVVGSENSISHTFTSAGTYTVKVSARNAAAGANGNKGQATRTITITDVPEHRFLLPVVTHAGGLAGSVWRTDVQIYNPDPNAAANPLVLKVSFNGQQQTITIPQSTMIFEDFMTRFTTGDASGPMIVSATTNYQPQIWTRTYNQTEQGTFGQFIPAVLLSGDGSGGAGTEAPKYYLAGLRQNDRYRTNIGFVNPNSTAIQITGTVYETEKGIAIGTFTRTLQPFTLDQANVQALLARTEAMPDRSFSVEVEAPAGKWLIAYASFIDSRTNDPTFLQAVRGGELASADYKEVVLPGVGRIGSWRSDVTVFNPDTKGVSLELAYYDQNGALKKKTGGIILGSLEMLQLDDLLRTSQMLVDGDSLGSLRLRVESTNNGHFPLVFGRTYFDSATGSYGQGINGISAKRANVKAGKPGLIPAVRSTSNYYTNIGLTNVTDKPVSVRVTLLDADTGATGLTETYELAAYQSIVRSPVGGVDIIKALSPNSQRASFRVEIVGGTGEVWAYASVIDNRTKDPEYIAAIPAQ